MAQRLYVYYDGQCEICQAGVTWLRLLDRRRLAEPVPISAEALARSDPPIAMEQALRELHVVEEGGRVHVGWLAVARLARLSRWTWAIGALGAVPPFRWLGVSLYRVVASNRYALSKCRGGACQVVSPGRVRGGSSFGAFWTCHALGMLARLPLSLAACIRDVVSRLWLYLKTWRRRVDLIEGDLTLVFLGGGRPDLVPLLFGEMFTMVLYKGVAVDPGSPLMRRSLARHLGKLPPGCIRAVVATHHHEEHVGNLNWLAATVGAPLHVSPECARILKAPRRLPGVRAGIIGQPPPLVEPYHSMGARLETPGVTLQVLPAPGHCDDHVVLYDPMEKVLLAGDAFMGSYFSTPNPDVDSRIWIETLERLLELDIEVLVGGHGHVHTLRRDIPDLQGVVIRRSPREALREKLDFMRWLRAQVESGLRERLTPCAIEATMFPWRASWTWERFLNDEMTRLLSLGHFSRSELFRSFVREPYGGPFPSVYEVRFHQINDPESRA